MPSRESRGLPTHTESLAVALAAVKLGPEDDAAKRLAVEYARQLDADPGALGRIGHMYLPILKALGLTPEARKAVAGGEVVNAGVSPLEKLRAARRVA